MRRAYRGPVGVRLYVAARLERAEEVKKIYEEAELRGWVITEAWARYPGKKDCITQHIAARQSEACVNGVLSANVFIMLSDPGGTGMYVELGVALSLEDLDDRGNILIYVVGEDIKHSIFFHHPAITKKRTVEDVFEQVSSSILG